jgi:uncharacterized protein YecT (DUF1311 family)
MKKSVLIVLFCFSFSTMAYENCTSENTKELERCSFGNYKSEDQLLNYLYKDIITSFPQIKDEVKKTQQLWIKARDEICAYTPDDGEEYKIDQNACLYQQTYERNRELKVIILKETSGNATSQSASKPKWDDYIKHHCDFMDKQFSDSTCKDRNLSLHSE